MSAPTRRRLPGGWKYDADDFAAAMMLGQWGLRLDDLDDNIEDLRALVTNVELPEGTRAELRDGLKFWERERARVVGLVRQDATGLAARDAARWLGMLLREQAQRTAFLIGQRRQAQVQGFSRRGADARRKYSDEDRASWRQLYTDQFARHTKTHAATMIAKAQGLPATAHSSIRDALKAIKKPDKPL